MKSKINPSTKLRTGNQKSKIDKFPIIYRFIPELFVKRLLSLNRKNVFGAYNKALKIFTLFIFIAALIVVGIDLNKNIKDKEKIDFEREKLTKEIDFWQSFLGKHKDYRDGYLRLSILEYKIRDFEKAKLYLNQALVLDPNSEKGKELGKIFGINK